MNLIRKQSTLISLFTNIGGLSTSLFIGLGVIYTVFFGHQAEMYLTREFLKQSQMEGLDIGERKS